jgi:hypothetical protein
MNNRIKITFFLVIACFIFSLAAPVSAESVMEKIIGRPLIPEKCTGAAGDVNDCGLTQMLEVVVNVSSLIVAMTGSVALLMFTVGGLMFIASAGNQERVQKGKAILQAAVIGIVLVLGAWMIINVIILALTKGDVGGDALIFGRPAFEEPKNIK